MSSESGSASGSGRTGRKSPAERSPVQVGDLVADKYRVEEILAAGGMGVVVSARHEELGQRFAIKFLVTDTEVEMSAARFLREARAAARIDSAHVCRVFDCGTLAGGTPYMVMEHLTGHDLAREIKLRGKLGVTEGVNLILQALEGIAEAHAAGIVHRDLKPSNLFLCQKTGREPEVKVLDFGISKVTSVDQSVEEDLTASAMMLGSPRYMSPEQVRNTKDVDARTDIWSLGVILYQMLDGHSPFRGNTMGETISKVLTLVPPPVRRARGDVPEALSSVIDRCLQRDRNQRYANVGELALALAPFATAESHASVRRITALLTEGQLGPHKESEETNNVDAAAAAAASEPQDEPSLGTQSAFAQNAPAKPRRFKLALGLALGLASVFAAGFFALRHAGGPIAQAASSAAASSAAASSAAAAPSAVPAASAAPAASVAEPAASTQAAASAAPEPSAIAVPTPASANSAAPAAPQVKAKHRPVHHRPASDDTDILKESY